jgi:hypothetical protein
MQPKRIKIKYVEANAEIQEIKEKIMETSKHILYEQSHYTENAKNY